MIARWARWAVLVLVVGLGLPLVPGSASADGSRYPATIATSCDLALSHVVRQDRSFDIRVHVRANSGTNQPRGEISLTVARTGGGKVAFARAAAQGTFTRTVNYPGHPISVHVPGIHPLGRYHVESHFTADKNSVFRNGSCDLNFTIRAGSGPDNGNHGHHGNHGTHGTGHHHGPGTVTPIASQPGQAALPDTGGPDLRWLYLGLGLLLGGFGLIGAVRRRQVVARRTRAASA